MNEKLVKIIALAATAILHLVVVFFLVFDAGNFSNEASKEANVMRLLDLEELPPPPPPEPEIPVVESIAEVMVETEVRPIQHVVAPGTIITQSFDDYLLAHEVETPPWFDQSIIAAEIVFPPIALRSGIEGRVILELFVDSTGIVQQITILREEPEERGFGEAAVKVFTDRKGIPAMANGEPVSCRLRFPVLFRIR
jgi:protein TonB